MLTGKEQRAFSLQKKTLKLFLSVLSLERICSNVITDKYEAS